MSEQAALDKKAIRKEILALIIPIILESIFVYLAGIVSASLVGHLSGLAVATQGLANRITGLLNVVWGAFHGLLCKSYWRRQIWRIETGL